MVEDSFQRRSFKRLMSLLALMKRRLAIQNFNMNLNYFTALTQVALPSSPRRLDSQNMLGEREYFLSVKTLITPVATK
jgi:hypothetical protein